MTEATPDRAARPKAAQAARYGSTLGIAASRSNQVSSGFPAPPNEVGDSGRQWSCALASAGMARKRRDGFAAAGAIAAIKPVSKVKSTGAGPAPRLSTPKSRSIALSPRQLSLREAIRPEGRALRRDRFAFLATTARRMLLLVNDADMRGDDAPAFGKTRPSLHLPTDLSRRIVAAEERRGDREIAAIGRDRCPVELARQAGRRAGGAERLDCLVPVEILGGAVADRLRRIAEERVERGDIVRHQGALVSGEGRFDFGEDRRIVDDHVLFPSAWMAAVSIR